MYTITFTSYGNSDAVLAGSLVVSALYAVGGTRSCRALTGPASLSGCTLSWSGVAVAAHGGTVTFTLTVSYADMPTGAVIDANLSASYVVSGSATSHTPSGVPAEIRFTLQGG